MDKQTGGETKRWIAMLSSLRACFGCGAQPRTTVESAEGFCGHCLGRSRLSSSDDLGGES